MLKVKANKSSLNKIIKWSSSKWNSIRKKDVVKNIVFLVEKGEDTEVTFETGSYSERGHLGGWDYLLRIKDGVATLTEIKPNRTVYLLEKQKSNKLYTGAKRIEVIDGVYDWHRKIIGKEFDVKNETLYYFHIETLIDNEIRTMNIDKNLVYIIN